MRIGEVSRSTGVSARLLRYYEERGLLRPSRSASGQRIYDSDAIQRIAQIRDLLAAGLGTDRIQDLLPCFEAPPHERTSHLLESLETERGKIELAIASLVAAADALDDVIFEVANPGQANDRSLNGRSRSSRSSDGWSRPRANPQR